MRKTMGTRIFAFTLAAAMVISGTSLDGTVASAKKKAGLKLSKSKLTLTVGKTATLKVKSAKKKVKWSTSNKKVAKITKMSGKKKTAATIKGLKKGSANITAKVGSKKAACKVTVKAAVTNIKKVAVDQLDQSCLVVTLKKAATVNIGDITLLTKGYDEGTYNSQVSIKSVTSADQTTYRFYTNSRIGAGRYIKLSIGKDSYEAQNKPDFIMDTSMDPNNYTILLKKDAVSNVYCDEYFLNGIGSLKFAVKDGALPTGMELNARKGLIKGIPEAVGDFAATIEATDEMGRKASVALNFKVYDDATVVTAPKTYEVRLDDYVEARVADTATNKLGETFYKSFEVAPMGGSGQYYFSLTASDTQGTALSTDLTDAQKQAGVTQKPSSTTRLRIPFNIAEGTHTFTVHIVDADNATIMSDATITLNAVKYYGVKGTAKDVNGSNLNGNRIYFIPKDAVSFNQYVEGMAFEKKASATVTAAPNGNSATPVYSDDDYHDYDSAGYWTAYYDYSARVGTSDTDTTIGKQKGTYATELKPGDYVVKIYSGADGIYYQMDQTVTVGAADMMQEVVTPVRFFSVMGTATYANGNPITNKYIYFEAQEEKFENNLQFGVKTDDKGSFIASLPANTYAAYVASTNNDNERLYFTTNIEVKDADVTLTGFALKINRSKVSGVARANGAFVSRYTDIYFFKNDTTTNTSNAESVEVGIDGAYSIELADGTYYAKFQQDGAWCSFGAVTVAGQNITMDLNYTIQNEMGDPNAVPEVTSGTAITVSDKGSFVKVNVPEGATGNYVLEVSTNTSNLYYLSGQVYDSSYNKYSISSYDDSNDCNFYFYSDSWEDGVATYSRTLNLKAAGTYYIKLVPHDNNYKTIPSAALNLSVTKSKYSWD